MKNLLISACLIGENCRYDGKSKPLGRLEELKSKYNLISACPEQLGGLNTPRQATELVGENAIDKLGRDVTLQFRKGAEACYEIAKKHNCHAALLKSNSPSCSCKRVYDGTFSGKMVDGFGIAARYLAGMGIKVYDEHEIEKLLKEYK